MKPETLRRVIPFGPLPVRLSLAGTPLWAQGLTAAIGELARRRAQPLAVTCQTLTGPQGCGRVPLDVLVVRVPADERAARPWLDVIRLARVISPNSRCLALVTARGAGRETLFTALSELGVEGVVSDRCSPVQLGQALTLVVSGERLMVPDMWGRPWHPTCEAGPSLSSLQSRVLSCLLKGMGPREAAARLGLTPKGFSTHKCALLTRLALSLPALIAASHRLGGQRWVLPAATFLRARFPRRAFPPGLRPGYAGEPSATG